VSEVLYVDRVRAGIGPRATEGKEFNQEDSAHPA